VTTASAAGRPPRRGGLPWASRIPQHCPYKLGQWVRKHAHPRAFPPGLDQHGWRGYVTDYRGGTILVGVTDDGRDWASEWGSLEPDRPRPPHEHCVCCQRYTIPPDLLSPGGVLATRRDALWWRSGWGARPVADLWDGGDDYPAVIPPLPDQT
jgi:hypothetical protein